MFTGYEVCVLYTAIKLHFDHKNPYDFFKFGGRIKNINHQNYELRNDKWYFHKISKVHSDYNECAFFIATNFFDRKSLWAKDLLLQDSEDIYRERLRIKESLTYILSEDLDHLLSCSVGDKTAQMKAILKVDDESPLLLERAQHGDIAVESLIALNSVMNFLPVWEKKLHDTILFPAFKHKCLAYEPFLEINRKKVVETLKMKLTA